MRLACAKHTPNTFAGEPNVILIRQGGSVLNKSLGMIAFFVFFLLGCTPKVWEVDTKLGVRVDSGSGFFAYYTPAPSVSPKEVPLFVASEDSVTRTRVLHREGGGEILPIGVSESKMIFVRPASLEKILEAQTGDFNLGEKRVEIGYFRKLIHSADSPGDIFQKGVAIVPGGWVWCEPTEKLEKKIREKIELCVRVAAEYGAEAITDITVFYTEETSPAYGGAGTYIYGKAVVNVVD